MEMRSIVSDDSGRYPKAMHDLIQEKSCRNSCSCILDSLGLDPFRETFCHGDKVPVLPGVLGRLTTKSMKMNSNG